MDHPSPERTVRILRGMSAHLAEHPAVAAVRVLPTLAIGEGRAEVAVRVEPRRDDPDLPDALFRFGAAVQGATAGALRFVGAAPADWLLADGSPGWLLTWMVAGGQLGEG